MISEHYQSAVQGNIPSLASFTTSPSAVVMVVSSTVSDPLESFSKLFTAQKQSEQQSKYPKWLTPHIFYYYVLLHDLSEGGDARCV